MKASPSFSFRFLCDAKYFTNTFYIIQYTWCRWNLQFLRAHFRVTRYIYSSRACRKCRMQFEDCVREKKLTGEYLRSVFPCAFTVISPGFRRHAVIPRRDESRGALTLCAPWDIAAPASCKYIPIYVTYGILPKLPYVTLIVFFWIWWHKFACFKCFKN